MTVLVEVKYFEPAKNLKSDSRLDGYLSHPARYRYANCFVDHGDIEFDCHISLVDGEGSFRFIEGKCSNFLGYFQAELLKVIPYSRKMEEDRFELFVECN